MTRHFFFRTAAACMLSSALPGMASPAAPPASGTPASGTRPLPGQPSQSPAAADPAGTDAQGAAAAGQPATGQAVTGQAASPAPSEGHAHDDTYVIGNSDVLAVTVWKQPDLSRPSLPVRPDGRISLPLVGELQAAGRTPLQLEDAIRERLRTYMTSPDVTVIVDQINSQKFNVLGRVAKPGSYPLTATTTVLDALASAGGFQDFAKQKGVYILRRGAGGQQTKIPFNYKDVIKGRHPEQNIRLEPGDTVIVP